MGNNKPENQQNEQETVPVSAIGALLSHFGISSKNATPNEAAAPSPDVVALQNENATLKTQVEQLQASLSAQTASTQASAREEFVAMATTKMDAGALADVSAKYDALAATPVAQQAFADAIGMMPKIEAATPAAKLTLVENPETKSVVQQDDEDADAMYAATAAGQRAKKIAAEKAA